MKTKILLFALFFLMVNNSFSQDAKPMKQEAKPRTQEAKPMPQDAQILTLDTKPITLPKPYLAKDKLLMQALSERKSSREFSEKDLSLQDFSNILWSANGVNRRAMGNRTSPSAMNKQDIDVYAVTKEGVYLYKADKHEIILIAGGDFRKEAGKQAYVGTAPLNLIYVSDTSKFNNPGDRSGIMITAALDAGHCSQNVYLYAASANLAVVARASIDKARMGEILKLKPQQVVILGQTVGYPK